MEKSTTSSSEPNIPEYQRRFVEMLNVFMEQCYVFIETQQVPSMTEEERIAKIKAITSLIREKENELVQLEAQRNALSSLSSTAQTTPGSTQESSSNYQCEPDCSADCSSRDKVSPAQKSSGPAHRTV